MISVKIWYINSKTTNPICYKIVIYLNDKNISRDIKTGVKRVGIQVIEDNEQVTNEQVISDDSIYDHCMYEIQKRMVDIGLMREENQATHAEVTDMFLLCKKLVEIQGVDDKLLAERLKSVDTTFNEKIK